MKMDIQQWSIKQLRQLLESKGVDISQCVGKTDLLELVLAVGATQSTSQIPTGRYVKMRQSPCGFVANSIANANLCSVAPAPNVGYDNKSLTTRR